MTCGCPDDFYAVRLGFPNITTSTYVVPAARAVPSSTWNDLLNPTGTAAPVRFTFINGGADSDWIATVAGAPTSIEIAANNTDVLSGETTIPKWTWSDWVNIKSLAPDPDTGMRVLMIRHTVQNSGGASLSYLNGMYLGWSGVNGVNHGYDTFVGGINNGGDRTGFDRIVPRSARANHLVNGAFVGAVQFMTSRRVVMGMTTGDSHHMGTQTSGSFNSYLAQVTTSMGSQNMGSIPFGWASTAMGGMLSQQFFPSLEALLPFVRPGYVVLPGWTANDPIDDSDAGTAANRFFARLLQAADFVRLNGGVPIFLTPFPRNPGFMTTEVVASWLALRQSILVMNELVVDATVALGSAPGGTLDGTYKPGLSGDTIHPNDAGHAAVASLLQPIIQKLLL